MKNQILSLTIMLLSLGLFAQKKELKEAQKSIKNSDFKSAITTINNLEGSLETMDSKYKSQFYFLKGQALNGNNDLEGAANAFNKLFEFETQGKFILCVSKNDNKLYYPLRWGGRREVIETDFEVILDMIDDNYNENFMRKFIIFY